MKNLVVFSMDTFGDIALRQSFFKGLLDDGCSVTVVVQAPFAVLIPYLDARLKWITTSLKPKALSAQDEPEILRLKTEIAGLKPDGLVSAEYFYTDIEVWLMLLFPSLARYGFDNPRLKNVFKITQPFIYWKLKGKRGPFNHLISGCQEFDHEFSKTQVLFKALTGQALEALPHIDLPCQDETILNALGLVDKKYVIAALGGNTNAVIKLLPIETCAQTLVYIQQKYQLPAVLTGVQSEEAHLLKIANRCQELGVEVKIWLGTSQTFGTLLYLIQYSCFYYGNDTGAMHLAGAMDIPVVAHFGGGGNLKFLPLAAKSYVAYQDLPCFGCGWHCWNKAPLCINRVVPQTLFKAVDWIMDPHTSGQQIDKGQTLSTEEFDCIQKKSRRYQKRRMIQLGLAALWRSIKQIKIKSK